MQINNFQRLVENITLNDKNKLLTMLNDRMSKMDNESLGDAIIILTKMASLSKVELETFLLQRIDVLRKSEV